MSNRTVREFLLDLKKRIEDNPEILDMPMYYCQTSSGVSEQVVSLSVSEVSEYDDGDIVEEELGTKYLALYGW